MDYGNFAKKKKLNNPKKKKKKKKKNPLVQYSMGQMIVNS
jgi:hypothetical protein